MFLQSNTMKEPMIKKEGKDDHNTLSPEIVQSKPVVAIALSAKKFTALRKRQCFK
jgi:hypothetical protein